MMIVSENVPLNKDVAGKEGAPNVYIDNIEIHSITKSIDGRMKLDWDAIVYLSLNADGKIVFEDLIKEGSIQIYYSTDEKTTNYLIDKKIDFDSESAINFLRRTNVRKERIAIPEISSYKKFLEFGMMTPVNLKNSIKLNKTDHLTIFAFFEMPKAYVYGQYISKKGPIVIEKIIHKGSVNYNSNLLISEDRKNLWAGPIHKHSSGQYMANSFHIDNRHSLLKDYEVLNLKIKDFRSLPITLPDPSLIKERNEKNKNMFSKIEFSQIRDKGMGFMFTTNLKNILLQTSKEAQILRRVNDQIFYNLIDKVTVTEMKIYSKESKRSRFNLVFRSKDKDNRLSPINTETKALREVYLTKNPLIRTYSGFYETTNVQDLKVEIAVSNPIKGYVENLLKDSRLILSEIKNYLSLLKSSAYYSKRKKTFKRKKIVTDFDNQGDIWLKAIDKYMNLVYFFVSKDDLFNYQDLLYSLMAKLSPKSCTTNSIELFIEDFRNLINKFRKVFEINSSAFSMRNSQQRRSPISSRGPQQSNVVSRLFKTHFKLSKKTKSYFRLNNRIPVVTTTQLLQIHEQELGKMSINPSTLGEYDDMIYLSPVTLQNVDDKFGFGLLKNLDNEKIKKFEDSLEISDKRLSSLFGTNIRAEIYEESPSSFEFSNLGNTSNFSSDEVIENIIQPDNRLTNSIASVSNEVRTMSMLDTADKVDKLPPHHAFLLNTVEAEGVIGNINSFFQTKQHSRDITFFNLKKVVFYTFPETNNELDLNNPTLVQISADQVKEIRRPVLGKIVDYYNPNFKVKDNKFEKYSTINNFFILYPDNYNLEKNYRTNTLPYKNLFRDAFVNYKRFDFYETTFLRSCLNEQPESRKKYTIKALKKQNRSRAPSVDETTRRVIERNNPRDYSRIREEEDQMALRTMIERTNTTQSDSSTQASTRSLEPRETEAKEFAISTENITPLTNNNRNRNRTNNRNQNRTNNRRSGPSTTRRGGY